MKSSFYFVAWLLVYELIGALNIDFLSNNSFLAAILIVMGVGHLFGKLFATTINNQQIRETAIFFERIYKNDVFGLKKETFKSAIMEGIYSVYFLLTIVGSVFLSVDDMMIYVVFAILFGTSCWRLHGLIAKYNSLKEIETFDEENIAGILEANEIEGYNEYRKERMIYAFDQMYPPKERSFIVFQIVSIIFAVICSILGTIVLWIFLPLLFTASKGEFFITAMVVYSSLAIFYGVKDFVTSIKSFKKY